MLLALWLACVGDDPDSGVELDPNDLDGDGYAPDEGDCDDVDATAHPGASERYYDGVDQDCDGASDDDADGDGVEIAEDCNDADAAVHPGAIETCDGTDNDCRDGIDFGAPGALVVYADADLDGWGGATATALCVSEVPTGYSLVTGDCDETNAAVAPGLPESCDGLDNDCDGGIDDDATDRVYVYLDADADGYGTRTSYQQVCSVPAGWAANATDCDDSSGAVHPAAVEVCDGVDNDCSGVVDAVEGCP